MADIFINGGLVLHLDFGVEILQFELGRLGQVLRGGAPRGQFIAAVVAGEAGPAPRRLHGDLGTRDHQIPDIQRQAAGQRAQRIEKHRQPVKPNATTVTPTGIADAQQSDIFAVPPRRT